jgi:hypothetical protein
MTFRITIPSGWLQDAFIPGPTPTIPYSYHFRRKGKKKWKHLRRIRG